MMPEQIISTSCPSCKKPVADADFFCPFCGRKLKDKPVSTGLARQFLIYFICIFFPPFGLIWAMKYFRSGTPEGKRIGIICIVLTFFSLALSYWSYIELKKFIDGLINVQMQQYQNLGI